MKSIISVLLILLYQVGFTQVTSGLVGHYPLDSLRYNDLTGTSHGYVSSRGSGAIYNAHDRFGNPESAANFDGGIIETSDEERGIINQVTVSAWVNTAQHEVPIKIICNQYYCTSAGGFLLYMKEGKVALDVRDVSPSRYISSGLSCSRVNDGYWHFVVGTLDLDGTLSIYVDGRLESSNTTFGVSSLHSGCNTAIGGLASGNTKNNAEPFHGLIDDVRIYNRALSKIEIDTLFAFPSPITTTIGCGEYNFTVYPNPVTDTLKIKTNIPGFTDYVIYDDIGRLVQRDTFKHKMVVIHFASGCYFLQIRNPIMGNRSFKFIVVNERYSL